MLLNWLLRLFINVWLGLFLALQVVRSIDILLRAAQGSIDVDRDVKRAGCVQSLQRCAFHRDGDCGLASIGCVSMVGTPQEKRMTASRRAQ